jgi:RNA polymerase sigma-70 factor (sigma-E family)
MTSTQAQPVAFADFVGSRRRDLLRFAIVLVGGDAQRAGDIVADVLTNAYEVWERIGGLDHPYAYVRRMIVNEYLSWRRRLTRTTLRGDLEPYIGSVADVAGEHAVRAELISRLRSLPRQQRAAVALRYFEDLPHADIADILGCSVGTTRSHISRALATLRVAMTEES